MNDMRTLRLAAGYRLTVTADATSRGTVCLIRDGGEPGTPLPVASGTSVTIEPDSLLDRVYRVDSADGLLKYTTEKPKP